MRCALSLSLTVVSITEHVSKEDWGVGVGVGKRLGVGGGGY